MRRGITVVFIAGILLLVIACNGRTSAQPSSQSVKVASVSTRNAPRASAFPWRWPFEPVEAPEPEGPGSGELACDPHYRWPIKTLADANANNVNLTPVDTTVAALRAYPNPTPFPLPSEYPTRIAPFEYTTWRLLAVTLYEIYPPGSDQDYHVILQDANSNQMISETVNVGCAPGTIVASQMTAVRSFIDAHWSFGSPPAPVFPNATVTVTGVGFFDPWTGDVHPPSGAELHPLLSMMLGTPGPSATPSQSPNPSPSPSPSRTPSPSPSPSPTPSPSPSPSPSGSPVGQNTYVVGTLYAPRGLFVTHADDESGAVSRRMDPTPIGSLRNEVITYEATRYTMSWGWVSGPNEPNLAVWPPSTYTVTLNVVVPNSKLQLEEVRIVRVNRYGGPPYTGLAVVARQRLSQSLGTIGTLIFTLSGTQQSAQSTDRLAVKFDVRNLGSTTQSFAFDAGDDALSKVTVTPR